MKLSDLKNLNKEQLMSVVLKDLSNRKIMSFKTAIKNDLLNIHELYREAEKLSFSGMIAAKGSIKSTYLSLYPSGDKFERTFSYFDEDFWLYGHN